MPNENESALWSILQQILEDPATGVVTPDTLATVASKRDAGLLHENESWTEWLARVRRLLERKGLLNGDGPVATVKQLATEEQRRAVGLSLGTSPAEHDLASACLLGARSGGAAAGCRPALPVPSAGQVQLSLDLTLVERARATAAQRDEEERLAALLHGGPPRPARPRPGSGRRGTMGPRTTRTR